MSTYQTTSTVEGQGQVLLVGVPFAPGTEVVVNISPKMVSEQEATSADDHAVAAARERMRQLLHTVKGFRNSPRIPREDLYDRGCLP